MRNFIKEDAYKYVNKQFEKWLQTDKTKHFTSFATLKQSLLTFFVSIGRAHV